MVLERPPGAGWKSQRATAEYEEARGAFAAFAGRTDTDEVAIICRNTTEAINHLAYRLGLRPDQDEQTGDFWPRADDPA